METSLDLSRWREKPGGVNYRRWAIVSTGLRQLLRTRMFRILLFVAWSAGMVLAVFGFLFSQTIASGGWLESSAAHLGPRFQATATALGAFVLVYPDVCIGGFFATLFWAHSYVGLLLSLVALSLIVPRLIARDRASNALVIYLARPLTSIDYLLGKLGTITGILLLTWTGPLLLGWLLSMALGPDRDFIVYSFGPLLRALLFNAIALVAIASIALGVSALTRSSRAAILLWIGLWIILGTMAKPPHTPAWLKHASFTSDLAEIRLSVFRLDSSLASAARQLPFLDPDMTRKLRRAAESSASDDFEGALLGLGTLVVLSSFVFLGKLRPE